MALGTLGRLANGWGRLTKSLGGQADGIGAALARTVLGVDPSGGVGSGPNDFKDEMEGYLNAYEKNVHVRACVDILAENAQQAVLKLSRMDGQERGDEITDHEVLDLIENPNPLDDLNGGNIVSRVVNNRGIYGIAYWYLEGARTGKPTEIYLMDPRATRVKNASRPDQFIGGYEYKPTGRIGEAIQYEPDEVIRFPVFNPRDPYQGLSPVKTALRSAAAAIYAEVYAEAFFRNSARPGALIALEGQTTPEQRQVYREEVERFHGGVGKAFRTMFMSHNARYQEVGSKLADTDHKALDDKARDKIAEVYRVPVFFLSGHEATNFATSVSQKKALWEEAIIPLLYWFAGILNDRLKPFYSDLDDAMFWFDWSNVPALAQARIENVAAIFQAVGVPFLDRNEGRRLLNFAERAGGDVLYTPTSMVPEDGDPLGERL